MLDWEKCLPVGFMLIMKFCTRMKLVPFALCAMGAVALSLAGCRKEEAKPETPASSPASYMHDEAFRKTLADRRKVAYSIGADRAKVEERLNEMRRIIGDKLGTTDRAKVEAALAENAEWRELQSKAKELDAAFERHRKETLRIVQERIAPKKEISK